MSTPEPTATLETRPKLRVRLAAYTGVSVMVLTPIAVVIAIAWVIVHFIIKFW